MLIKKKFSKQILANILKKTKTDNFNDIDTITYIQTHITDNKRFWSAANSFFSK